MLSQHPHCNAYLLERYITETVGCYLVYNSYGVVVMTTYDREEALTRARLIDGIERMEERKRDAANHDR